MFHVGDVVRKLRTKQGLTVEELAIKAGVDKGTVSSIERGRNYRADRLAKVAEALGVPVNKLHVGILFEEHGADSHRLTEVEAEVLDLLRDIPEDQLQPVLDVLRAHAALARRAHALRSAEQSLPERPASTDETPAKSGGRRH